MQEMGGHLSWNWMGEGQFLLYSLAPGFTLNFITIIDGPVYGVLMSLTDWLNGLISPGASSAQFTTLSSFPPLSEVQVPKLDMVIQKK